MELDVVLSDMVILDFHVIFLGGLSVILKHAMLGPSGVSAVSQTILCCGEWFALDLVDSGDMCSSLGAQSTISNLPRSSRDIKSNFYRSMPQVSLTLEGLSSNSGPILCVSCFGNLVKSAPQA
jgi:hypothetical protein